MQNHKLYRSKSDKMLAGVCGGLGEYFAVDPTVVRLLFVLLALLGGHGVLIYLIMLIIVPVQPVEQIV
jgi:phage shock protein C